MSAANRFGCSYRTASSDGTTPNSGSSSGDLELGHSPRAGGKKPVSPDTAHPALDLAGDALEHQRLAVWPVDQPVPPIAGLSAERENPDDLGAALEFAQDRGWMSDRVLASAASAWGAHMILTTRSSARACARRG
jgi:hypothetical protein